MTAKADDAPKSPATICEETLFEKRGAIIYSRKFHS